MKKLTIGFILLYFIGIYFSSCEKIAKNDKSTISEHILNSEESSLIKEVELKIKKIKNSNDQDKSNLDPSFRLNSFDYIGVDHNIQLKDIHNHPNFNRNPDSIIKIYNETYKKRYGNGIILNPIQAKNTVLTLKNKFIVNNKINYDWFLTLNVSNLEKEMLRLYLTQVYSTNDISMRISISKEIETSIINSSLLDLNSKERLLSCFSIFRHSTYYWSTFNKYAGMSPLSEAIDAIVAEMCMDGSISVSGFDVSCPGVAHGIGSLVSAVCDGVMRSVL